MDAVGITIMGGTRDGTIIIEVTTTMIVRMVADTIVVTSPIMVIAMDGTNRTPTTLISEDMDTIGSIIILIQTTTTRDIDTIGLISDAMGAAMA
jgi:hypothetical protein